MRLHSALGIRRSARCRYATAFTLVELLVVITIIAVLIGILIPVVGKIRTKSYSTMTASVLNQIDQACQAYYSDFHAYPGPLPNSYLDSDTQTSPQLSWLKADGTVGGTLGASASTGGTVTPGRVTASENLVLGLCGGLVRQGTATPYTFAFKADEVGGGPRNFNPIRPSRAQPYFPGGRSLSPYDETRKIIHFEEDPTNLMGTMANASKDSRIPEFIDSFPNGMPILYMRARGGVATISTPTSTDNAIVEADPNQADAAYNLVEITPYTTAGIGLGRTVTPANYVGASASAPHGLATVDVSKSTNKAWTGSYQYPYDAFDYLSDPTSYDRTAAAPPTGAALSARRVRKDTYVLIAPGPDRVYGTEDDITNFGSVLP